MDLKETLDNIKGIDERFASLIIRYVDSYINMSSNKTQVASNLIQQIKKNVTEINFASLDGISGCVSGIGSTITIDSNLPDWVIDNTFLHEFTHQISRNEYTIVDEENGMKYTSQPNRGLKVGIDQDIDFSWGFELPEWETDGNNYAFNKGIVLFDEWITEWLANKMSGFTNVELKQDENGFFRKKTCHGYDGSNVMNMLELVYGSENVANIITGMDLTEEERRGVIPIKEFHKLNEMIDSETVISPEELEIFKNLQPPYMKTPNITGLLVYYISEYQKQDTLEDHNVYIQKMINLLSRTYSIGFKNRIVNCNNAEDLKQIYNELSTIQNSMIWNENQEVLNSLESYRLYDEMRNLFINKANRLNISNEQFSSLYATPSQLLENFKLDEAKYMTERTHNSKTNNQLSQKNKELHEMLSEKETNSDKAKNK